MVRIDAHFFMFQVVPTQTKFLMSHLHLVYIWPSKQTSINDMREVLLFPNLQPSIHCSLHRDTFWWLPSLGCYCQDERVQFVKLLFKFLDEGFNGTAAEAICITTLMSEDRMPQQVSNNDGTGISRTRDVTRYRARHRITWPRLQIPWLLICCSRSWGYFHYC